MKKINRVWSIGLIVVVLASLLMFASPATPAAAANPLQWNQEAVPTPSGYLLQTPGNTVSENVSDIAVGSDGMTIYAATGNTSIYKSTNGGASWSAIPTTNGNQAAITPTFVAVAPDNNNMVAIATSNISAVANTVYISTNGGASWGTLQVPTGSTGTATLITDIDVSPLGQNSNYLAVAGLIGIVPEVWYYSLGVGGIWTPTSALGGFGGVDNALAIKFSPSFPSDLVLTAVTVNGTRAQFEMFSINQKKWNLSASFSGYPVLIGASIAPTAASIALAPTYLGGDETSRVAFVGVTNGGTTTNGIYRLEDTTVAYIKSGIDIYSVAYDGNSLVGGETTRNIVWRSADPLDTTPNFFPSTATKSPGGPAANLTILAYAGTNVVAGTSGASCAFSVSNDAGASFNDISLIRAILTTMVDVAVAADGTNVYLVTKDASATSVWRYTTSWQRVLTLSDVTNNYIVRLAPANPQVVYIAAVSGLFLYYGKAGGDTKWYTRTGPHVLGDLAVEDDNIAYMGWSNGANVQKTLNGGFTWSTPADTQTGASGISTIRVLSASNVIVGGNNGMVGYTTDASATWSKIPQLVGGATGAVQVTANGLTSGSIVVAAVGGVAAGTLGTWIWTIGQPGSSPWTDEDPSHSVNATGIQLASQGNWLYVASAGSFAGTIYRSNLWTIPNPPAFDAITTIYGATNIVFGATPSSLRLSSTATSNKLWAIDTLGAKLYSFDDTMAVVAPALSSPANKAVIGVNSISGNVYNITFTWPAVNGVIYPAGTYELKIATDTGMTQVFSDITTVSAPGTAIYYQVTGLNPNTTYYWQVRTKLPVTSLWSEQRSFTTGTTPEVVAQLLTPANGEAISEVTPAFSWSPIAGATKYQFQMALNTDFMPTVVDQIAATPGVRPIVKLNTDMVYFWRVRATEPVMGGWSAVANFKVTVPVTAAPPVVVTTAPPPVINLPPITMPPAIVNLPPTPTQQPVISTGLLWAVIIIGAILVIALIVLIVRTRRSV